MNERLQKWLGKNYTFVHVEHYSCETRRLLLIWIFETKRSASILRVLVSLINVSAPSRTFLAAAFQLKTPLFDRRKPRMYIRVCYVMFVDSAALKLRFFMSFRCTLTTIAEDWWLLNACRLSLWLLLYICLYVSVYSNTSRSIPLWK